MLQLNHMRCPHLLPGDPMTSHHFVSALHLSELLRKGVLAAAEVAHAICDVQGHPPHALLGAHAVVRPSVLSSSACRLARLAAMVLPADSTVCLNSSTTKQARAKLCIGGFSLGGSLAWGSGCMSAP